MNGDVAERSDNHETEAKPARKRGGGPRTPEGKARASANALKHGLRSKVLLPEDLAATVAERKAQFAEEFGPATAYEAWLIGELALASARLDRCAEMALIDMRRSIDRALLCWEDDRRKLVDDLGARLSKDPSRIARALGRSKQGADWLIERWEGLGDVLRARGDWDDAQRRLAFDLLGVVPELREGCSKVPPPGDVEGMADLVARQVARLREDRDESLETLDDAARSMAAAGMPTDEDPATSRLRRYEASCRRAMNGALAELRRVRDASAPSVSIAATEATVNQTPELAPFPISKAGSDYLATRAEAVLEARWEAAIARIQAERDADEVAALEATVDSPLPSPMTAPIARPAPASPFSAKAPEGNRRERLARRKRERQDARRAGR